MEVVVPTVQFPQVPTEGLVGSTLCVVAINIRYPAFSETELQVNAGVSETAVAPLVGADSVGAGRLPPVVVKLKMLDQAPCALVEVGIDCTCQ